MSSLQRESHHQGQAWPWTGQTWSSRTHLGLPATGEASELEDAFHAEEEVDASQHGDVAPDHISAVIVNVKPMGLGGDQRGKNEVVG